MPMVCSAGSRPQWPNGLSDQGRTSRQQAAATDCTVGAQGWAPLAVGKGYARVAARFAGAGRGDIASDRLPLNYNAGGAAMARAVVCQDM